MIKTMVGNVNKKDGDRASWHKELEASIIRGLCRKFFIGRPILESLKIEEDEEKITTSIDLDCGQRQSVREFRTRIQELMDNLEKIRESEGVQAEHAFPLTEISAEMLNLYATKVSEDNKIAQEEFDAFPNITDITYRCQPYIAYCHPDGRCTLLGGPDRTVRVDGISQKEAFENLHATLKEKSLLTTHFRYEAGGLPFSQYRRYGLLASKSPN